ncbi:metallophosphoesterase family protein [Actinocorallia sp. A-T 12471]|uniref:metallophosphoesterase family protein n=1 Tax=Actinocorallia sp. A-T 12471 TaxID=3089813 RepID=UPI0029D1DB2C|nr:metallophosphoesterase [Actinocorallia sp. A-T 12471]MDX6739501.1 metallophosphoesterase [Actinocorallia sp. A-T 12471]
MTSPRSSHNASVWGCQEPGVYTDLGPRPALSWMRPSVLWRSRNDVIAKWFGDPVDEVRRRWVQVPQETPMRTEGETFSFLVLGDTGEGDSSQYAVVPGMLRVGQGTRFAVVASDVNYPVGSVNDYGQTFFKPYQAYPAPIYAVPGNHDWYDGLEGFMRVFCDRIGDGAPGPTWKPRYARLATKLWRKPEPTDEDAFTAARALRAQPSQQAKQPGPYWFIDSPRLRVVGLDTGIGGGIDRDQGEWLRRVSADPRPKLLITGKPIYRNNEYRPCQIEGGGTVDEIVRTTGYVAVIGGDIHNYQHYPVDVDGHRIDYLVAGGSGAYMHATHTIPAVDIRRDGETIVDEDAFFCHPLRGDSLVFYSRLYADRLRRFGLRRFFELDYPEAAAAVSRRLGVAPTRPEAQGVVPGLRARMVASLLAVPDGRKRRPLLRLPVNMPYHRLFSEASDSDAAPFFKTFLRLDITPGELHIRCFGATGCRAQELEPPVEHELRISLR